MASVHCVSQLKGEALIFDKHDSAMSIMTPTLLEPWARYARLQGSNDISVRQTRARMHVCLSLSEAGPGRFGDQVSVIDLDIYHTIPYYHAYV